MDSLCLRAGWLVGLTLCLVLTAPVSAQVDVNQAIQETGAIFTYLLDTGTSSPFPLQVEAVEKKAGWTILGEDVKTYEFKGDAVLLNDKLVVVLRRQGLGAEVYTRTRSGLNQRAVIAPRSPSRDRTQGLKHIRIVENHPGAVEVEATFDTQGATTTKTLAVAYRLTTGQPYMQVQPSRGVGALRVQVPTQFLVVPDFFADDLVYDARKFTQARIGLPVENFYLHLTGSDRNRPTGRGIVTCIWKSNPVAAGIGQTAAAFLEGEGDNRIIEASEIACADGKTIWVAFMEHDQVWHSYVIASDEAQEDLLLKWDPPFPAKWRGNFVGTDEAAESWDFKEGRLANYEAPGFGKQVYPCWFQTDKPYVRPPNVRPARRESTPSRLLVIYPIDRSQATPLNEFCLIDIMRNTLGVGACQYVLDLEGLDSESTPAPALTMEWVEKQFKKKKETRYADEIQARLKLMVDHVRHVEDRIVQYSAFEREVRELYTKPGKGISRDAITGIDGILDNMAYSITLFEPARKTPELAEQLAEQVIGLFGKDGAYAECERIGRELRSMGDAQDRTLSKCRMAVRRLGQHCLTMQHAASGEPDTHSLLDTILDRTEQFLYEKQ